jgi:hypothetical protein
MKKKLLALSAMMVAAVGSLVAQTRYCDEVFSNINITDSVVYATNKIYFPFPTGIPPQGNLYLELYQPEGDTAESRPLAIVLHTGNFLPQPYNQSITGSRKDSNVVETCKRLARRGFVAAAVSYRLGWNPLTTDQDVRTSTLLKAVYRAVQDARTSVRFFRKDAATSNEYKIDPNKIFILGFGSGGYVTLAAGSLDKWEEVTLPKFLDGNTGEPYVDTTIMGNFWGLGGNPDYNIENHVGYSSDINLVVNAGGALGDSTWLEAGDPPVIAFHVPGDPFAPYTEGMVIVPTTGGNVVYVSGSYDVVLRCNNPIYGNNNAIFTNPPFIDPLTIKANSLNNGYDGLFPFYTVNPSTQAGPWDWWDPTDAVAKWGQGTVDDALVTNPNMSKNKGMAYLDTIFGYSIPRIVRVFGLDNCPGTIGIAENNAKTTTKIFPNPTVETVNASTAVGEGTITEVAIFDNTGRLVKQVTNLRNQEYTLNVKGLSKGVYQMQVSTTLGKSSHKLVIE